MGYLTSDFLSLIPGHVSAQNEDIFNMFENLSYPMLKYSKIMPYPTAQNTQEF